MNKSSAFPTNSDIINDAFSLWETYDFNVREVTLNLLLWVAKQEEGGALLYERFIKSSDEKYLRLLNDSRLRNIKELEDFSSYVYKFALPEPAPEIIEPDLMAWLDNRGFTTNPFGNGVIGQNPLLAGTWAPPQNWDEILKPFPSLIVSDVPEDIDAAAWMLHYRIRSENKEIFTVNINLPELAAKEPGQFILGLSTIAHACAEAWLSLLSLSPEAYLDLPRSKQLLLAEFLHWASGGFEQLRLWLLQQGYIEDQGIRRLVIHNLQESIGKLDHPSHLTSTRLLSWMDLRPPGMTQTYLLVECNLAQPFVNLESNILNLFNFHSMLAQAGILLKVFLLRQSYVPPSDVKVFELKWDQTNLQVILRDRLYLSSKNTFRSLNDLLAPGVPAGADKRLLNAAGASLSELLKIGNFVLRDQSGQDYLDINSFDKIIQPVS